MQGLRTISPHEAKLQAKIEAAKLDAYWTQMRLARSGVLGLSLIWDGIDVRDPFVGVYYDRSKSVVTPKPIPINDLRRVQRECMQIDDDIRWLVALISDTGMRLAEAAGLSVSYFTFRAIFSFRRGAPTPVAQPEDVCKCKSNTAIWNGSMGCAADIAESGRVILCVSKIRSWITHPCKLGERCN